MYLLSLLAREHSRSELFWRISAYGLEKVFERIRSTRALVEGRPAREAHSGVLARGKLAPLDGGAAAVDLAELDLVEREHQSRHEPIRLVVVRHAQRAAMAAHRWHPSQLYKANAPIISIRIFPFVVTCIDHS